MEDGADHVASNWKGLDGSAWRLGERMSLGRKPSILIAIGALAAGLSMGSTAALAAPTTTYPIVCKGGVTMHFAFGQGTSHATVLITFAKAPAGASQQPPGPGQCAWLDRPISQAEPSKLRFRARVKSFRVIGERMNFISVHPPGAQTVLRAVLGGARFHIHAYNAGSTLQVTRFGP